MTLSLRIIERAVDRLAEFPTLLHSRATLIIGRVYVSSNWFCAGCRKTLPYRERCWRLQMAVWELFQFGNKKPKKVECEIAPTENSLAGDDRGEH